MMLKASNYQHGHIKSFFQNQTIDFESEFYWIVNQSTFWSKLSSKVLLASKVSWDLAQLAVVVAAIQSSFYDSLMTIPRDRTTRNLSITFIAIIVYFMCLVSLLSAISQ